MWPIVIVLPVHYLIRFWAKLLTDTTNQILKIL